MSIELQPATEQLQLLRERRIGAVELLELLLARIERLNPRLNAVVARDVEEMANLLTNEIPKVRGVVRLAPGLALNVLKYESQWAPLL